MKRHFPGTFFPAVDIGFHCKSGAIILTIAGMWMGVCKFGGGFGGCQARVLW